RSAPPKGCDSMVTAVVAAPAAAFCSCSIRLLANVIANVDSRMRHRQRIWMPRTDSPHCRPRNATQRHLYFLRKRVTGVLHVKLVHVFAVRASRTAARVRPDSAPRADHDPRRLRQVRSACTCTEAAGQAGRRSGAEAG